jgi:histidyl-tRNA synthetase
MGKTQITILLSLELLSKIDALKEKLGISRASLIANSVRIYELFMNNQLNSNANSESSIKEQMNRIEIMLNKLNDEESRLKNEIRLEMKNVPVIKNEIKNFDEIKTEITKILSKFKTLSISMLSKLLNYEEGVLFMICTQLEKDEIITLNEKCEWSLI